MRFEVRLLRYWKEEYGDIQHCEDAAASNPEAGLFAVSDGVGEMSFSNRWANILVQRFVEEPLLTNDACEVEYWLREARAEFSTSIPPPESLPWFARDKAGEGSAATLVCARFRPYLFEEGTAENASPGEPRVWCRLLAIGDSCALQYCGDELLYSFPYASASQFSKATECFPTKGYHTVWWQGVRQEDITLRKGDVLVLVTDAVAKWLLCDSEEVRAERIALLLAQTEQDWPRFVQVCRRAGLMDDDDSTALIIKVLDPSGSLPKAREIEERAKQKRLARIKKAKEQKDYIEIAILYGDGSCFADHVLTTKEENRKKIEIYRRMAEGRRKLLASLHRNLQTDYDNRPEIQMLWNQYGEDLKKTEFGKKLEAKLKEMGIELDSQPDFPAQVVDLPAVVTEGSATDGAIRDMTPEAASSTAFERTKAEERTAVLSSPDQGSSKSERSIDADAMSLPNESGTQPTIDPSGSAQDARRDEELFPFTDSGKTQLPNS